MPPLSRRIHATVRGLGSAACLLACSAHGQDFVPPAGLTLAGVDYARQSATHPLADAPHTWRYTSADGQENGPWETAIVLTYRPGPVTTPQQEAQRLRQPGSQPGQLQQVKAQPSHAYWHTLQAPLPQQPAAYATRSGKSFHPAACKGVVHYVFEVRYPMKWEPSASQRADLLQALERDSQRALAALARDDWQPECR